MYSRRLSLRMLVLFAVLCAACSYIFPVAVETYFPSCRYECEETKEAGSALSRVRSDECRAKIREALCLRKQSLNFPESTCPYHNTSLINKYSGCYADTPHKRALQGALYKGVGGNVCQALCYRPGFLYYAYDGANCLCGNNIESAEATNNYTREERCLLDAQENCDQRRCLMVYHTGLTGILMQQKQLYVNSTNISDNGDPVKILFLLQLNGRNDRQVKRLIRAIYSPKHLYIVHIDKRQQYMKQEMEKLASLLPNLHVLADNYSTIWGGASLLKMYLDAIAQSLTMEKFSKWDYLINLSESDFPILSMEELEAQLQTNRGKTYLASHNYNTAQFIVKQGFDHFFVECDEHMWRIGSREELPKNIRIDGGSDWLVLHKDFAKYSVSNEHLPRNLRRFFTNVLLPLESFYHTLARNSHFCDTIINGNLKFTNWNRKQGCRCESLKNVVDWCGCSPLAIKGLSKTSLELDNAISKSYYFARKFDSIVDIDAISFVEKQVLRFRPEQIREEHASFNSAFTNFYKRSVDGPASHLELLAGNLLNMLNSSQNGQLDSIYIFKANSTSLSRIVFTIKTDLNTIQLLVDRKNRYQIFPNATIDGYLLNAVQFGVNIDYKEEIFRDPISYVNMNGTPTAALRWSSLHAIKTGNMVDKTSPHVMYSWFNSEGMEVAIQNVKPYNSIYGKQFSSLDLSSLDSWQRKSGVWKVRVHRGGIGAQTLAEIFFPVFSTYDPSSHFRMAEMFFSVVDSCIDTECETNNWSTFYPDPKIDVRQS